MNDLTRFTSPASGKNIKELLKKLGEKGEQLRQVLWLESNSLESEGFACTCELDEPEDCDCGCEDEPEQYDPCQFELSVRNKVVFAELSQEQVLDILPHVKKWVVADLEAIEKQLNNQGVYLESVKAAPKMVNQQAAPSFSVTKRLQEGDVCTLLKDHQNNPTTNGMVTSAGTHVEVTRYYPGELYDLVDATVRGTNISIQINANSLRRL